MRGTRLALGGGNGIGCGVLGGLVGGDRLLQRLQPELQLVGGQLLRPAAELVARQPLDQQSQLVVLGVQHSLPMQYRPQHLLQGRRVVGQGVEIDLHRTMMTDAAASQPALFCVGPLAITPRVAVAGGMGRPATRTRRARQPAAMPTGRSGRWR